MLCILYLNIRMSMVSQLFGKYQYIVYIKSLAILVRAINTFFYFKNPHNHKWPLHQEMLISMVFWDAMLGFKKNEKHGRWILLP